MPSSENPPFARILPFPAYDTAEGWIEDPEPIPRLTALRWLRLHSACLSDFFDDCGDRDYYDSDQIFVWLGY